MHGEEGRAQSPFFAEKTGSGWTETVDLPVPRLLLVPCNGTAPCEPAAAERAKRVGQPQAMRLAKVNGGKPLSNWAP